jgi:hypothetical protein
MADYCFSIVVDKWQGQKPAKQTPHDQHFNCIFKTYYFSCKWLEKGWEIWVNECLKIVIIKIFEAYTFQ